MPIIISDESAASLMGASMRVAALAVAAEVAVGTAGESEGGG